MKVLVYGWYHQGNIGDDLFIEAFQHLFPDYEFVFTDSINSDKLKDVDAVFFGGGSFLLDRPVITMEALDELKSKKICYLGVGVEKEINPIHIDLIKRARMVAIRSPDQTGKMRLFNKHVSVIPDLVFSLQEKVKLQTRINRSVLIMPNANTIPQSYDPHWKHAAWEYFKSEFVQFLDWLIDWGFEPSLFSMCNANEIDDGWAAGELVSRMNKRQGRFINHIKANSLSEITDIVSRYEVLITQRFHGIVLAEMTRTPYVAIYHHDKLKSNQPGDGIFISYYNSSKQSYIDAFDKAFRLEFKKTLPIESTIFETFSKEVTDSLK